MLDETTVTNTLATSLTESDTSEFRALLNVDQDKTAGITTREADLNTGEAGEEQAVSGSVQQASKKQCLGRKVVVKTQKRGNEKLGRYERNKRKEMDEILEQKKKREDGDTGNKQKRKKGIAGYGNTTSKEDLYSLATEESQGSDWKCVLPRITFSKAGRMAHATGPQMLAGHMCERQEEQFLTVPKTTGAEEGKKGPGDVPKEIYISRNTGKEKEEKMSEVVMLDESIQELGEGRGIGLSSDEASTVSRAGLNRGGNQPVRETCKRSTCEICGKMFANNSNLQRHIATIHNQDKGKQPSKPSNSRRQRKVKGGTCHLCGRYFTQRNNLRRHLTTVHQGEDQGTIPLKDHQCGECGRTFTRSTYLKEHLVVHRAGDDMILDPELLPHECRECGLRFVTKPSLNRHARLHKGVRKFMCLDCDAAFLRRDELSQHFQVMHSGGTQERLYQCQQCGKNFATEKYLQIHKLVHSQEQRHQCEDCGKWYIRRSDLNRHRLLHTRPKGHVCEQCGRTFNFKGNLQAHLACHAAQGPSCKCPLCGMMVAQQKLDLHTRKLHKQHCKKKKAPKSVHQAKDITKEENSKKHKPRLTQSREEGETQGRSSGTRGKSSQKVEGEGTAGEPVHQLDGVGSTNHSEEHRQATPVTVRYLSWEAF